ncbi:MAG: cation-translocating P-type ATPase [Luteolibacter sp.]
MIQHPSSLEDPKGEAWHHRSAAEVLAHFCSTPAGLSTKEATLRLVANGRNELTGAPGVSALRILLAQFESLVIWILIAAGVVAGVLGERVDAAAIFAIVILNAAVGLYQEFNAEKSIAALRKLAAPHAKVIRDGKVRLIPAAEIVVGDVLELESGDLVAADARILSAAMLRCIEAPLTGESQPVTKRPATLEALEVPLGDRENMVFMGTSIATGTGRAVIVATAMKTELGHIAELIEDAGTDKNTPLEKKLEAFGRVLVWAALGIVALLFGLGLMRGTPPLELFMTSISLAVAAVPEGLPAVVTVALALGVRRMARRGALVRKLAAVETLGSTSVICTDKTGTLTIGEMTVRALYAAGQGYTVTGEGYGPDGDVRPDAAPLRELVSVILGCNNAHLIEEDGKWKTVGDPTEGALLAASRKAGGDRAQLNKDFPKFTEIPFDSDRKLSTMIRKMPGEKLRAFINGAPGPLLQRCTHLHTGSEIVVLTQQGREEILAQTMTMARQALRVLASAWRDLENASPDDLTADFVERDLVFIGLSGMYDPPRQEAKDAVARCRSAGIRVVMITGDHPQTAEAIAREIGIAEEAVAITGAELGKMSDDELRRRLPEINVYARVTAEHKLRIVRSLKTTDAVVAMTGDGVNDAPAIKGADIGIAMGKGGTEVTRQAADIIITDDNFATIVAAVEEGRGIYANIRKTLQYLLAGSTAELSFMMACVIIGLPTPLLPIHLLWINLVTDGLPALCLATDAIDPDVMKRGPRGRSESLTNPRFLRTMLLTGFLTAGVAFAVYRHVLLTGTLESARAAAFAVLVFAELLRAFGARSEIKPVWRISLLTNLNLVVVVTVSFGLQVWSQHSATLGGILKTSYMSFTDCLLLLAVGSIPLLVLELVKSIRRIWPTTA